MRNTTLLLSCLLCAAACDESAKASEAPKGVAAASAAADKPAPAADAPARAAKPEAPAPAPVEMIEHDLSGQKGWEGWRAKGPSYAKVMGEMRSGARIAGGGSRLEKDKAKFDLAFYPAKRDFAELKAGLDKGIAAAAADANAKITFTSDTPELLEWTTEMYGKSKYNFLLNFQAGGKDVACGTNSMVGLETPEAIAMHKEACKSLTKA